MNSPLHDFGQANYDAFHRARRSLLRTRGLHYAQYMNRWKYRSEKVVRALFPVGTCLNFRDTQYCVLAYAMNSTVLILARRDDVHVENFNKHPHFGWYYRFDASQPSIETEMELWCDVLDSIPALAEGGE